MKAGCAKSTNPQVQMQGFTMLEVLVAVFILSLGMLGIAALQVTSKRTNFEAVQRTSATFLTQDLLERIRSNPAQMTTYTNAGAGRTMTLTGADGITSVDCASAACTTPALAMYDLYEFSQALSGVAERANGNLTGGLVSPTVCITGPAARPGYVNVAIAWRGMTKLSDPGSNACGATSGFYDAPSGGTNVYRRVLFVNTYVN